jgi:hypothetical protein
MPLYETTTNIVRVIYSGLGPFRQAAEGIMLRRKIVSMRGREVFIKPDSWIDVDLVLGALGEIGREIGLQTLENAGRSIVRHFPFPSMTNMRDFMELADVAYLTNHRRDGVIMHDVKTGKSLDGIGHFRMDHMTRDSAVLHTDSVYPCRFNFGTVSECVAKLMATVDHGPSCKERGQRHCDFRISWKPRVC